MTSALYLEIERQKEIFRGLEKLTEHKYNTFDGDAWFRQVGGSLVCDSRFHILVKLWKKINGEKEYALAAV